jgi:hypothetical protein
MIAEGANPLIDHVWGISPGADRVWAQISGIAPSTRPWERLFVVLQAYIDESYTANGVFVLGGYIATAEAWAAFSKEWEGLLPLTMRGGEFNKHRFKMSEMSHFMDRVHAFHRVIENHVILSIYCKINIPDIRKAQAHIWVPDITIDWGIYDNAFRLSVRFLLDMFHEYRNAEPIARLLPLDQPIDFYFDNHSSKRPILNGWDDYLAGRRGDVRRLYGNMPYFGREEEFLGLQAADFWAWWVRKAYNDGFIDRLMTGDFGHWAASRLLPGIQITFTEEQITKGLIQLVRPLIEPEKHIYNVRFFWNGKIL